jgi:hypothetical protein
MLGDLTPMVHALTKEGGGGQISGDLRCERMAEVVIIRVPWLVDCTGRMFWLVGK